MRRTPLFVILFGLLLNTVSGQTLTAIAELSGEIEETSGLLYIDGRLITHNDSGGSNKLYETNVSDGSVVDDVFILDASATDWEDICADEEHIFIGDFGNNDGTRTNLEIYKIRIDDFLDGNGNATATELDFFYGDQTNFTSQLFQTNFDAETLVAYEDHLLIFTKDWGDGNTRIYAVSKVDQGNQELNPLASLPVEGLITGGVYDAANQRIVLVGYQNFLPFIIQIEVDGTLDFSTFSWSKDNLDTRGGSTQIEGVSLAPNGGYYLSGERTAISEPTLYLFSSEPTGTSTTGGDAIPKLFPNPATSELNIEAVDYVRAELYDVNGKKVRATANRKIEVADLARGTYTVMVYSASGKTFTSNVVLQ
ncbi:MAG: T9SS type A sorting domain-containing protein [Saprospiraceae bacterium]